MLIVRNIFVLVCLLFVSAHSQWISIPSPSSNVCFADEHTGWKYINYGGIYVFKTTNGGGNWVQKYYYLSGSIPNADWGESIWFTDAQNGYIGTAAGRLLRTTDGGETWETKIITPSIGGPVITSAKSSTIWAVGSKSFSTQLLRSTDKGNSWTKLVSVTVSQNCKKPLVFTDSLHGWYYSTNSRFIRTQNGGLTWDTIPRTGNKALCMQFKDSLTGWLGCDSGMLALTVNGGLSWTQQQLFSTGSVIDLHWNGTELWALGEKKHLAVSRDLGSTWDTTLVMPDSTVNKIVLFDSQWGYLANDVKLFHYDKSKPLFALDLAKTTVDDTVFTIGWFSSLINTFMVKTSTDNGATWHVAASGVPATNKQVTFTVPDSVYQFKIYDDARPLLPVVFFDSVSAENKRSVNAITANQLRAYQTGDGMSMHVNTKENPGIYWPGGSNASKIAVFADGIYWAGYKNNILAAGGASYRSGLQPGRILADGTASDPNDPGAGLYRIKKNWESLPESINKNRLKQDYQSWPSEWGAPFDDVNHDGEFTAGTDKPGIIGDETMWYVANDLDAQKTYNLHGSQPIGLEVRMTMFASNEPTLKNIIFKKYEIFNRSGVRIDSMFMGAWADPDIGNSDDDFVGCDSMLNLGFAYNGLATDTSYGNSPPAVGYVIVQGPALHAAPNDSAFFNWKWKKEYKNKEMTSFGFFIIGNGFYADPVLGAPAGTYDLYKNLNGATSSGIPYTDPNTNQSTVFPLSGDPITQTGWYEGHGGTAPGDRRMLLSCGPISFAPGEKQEFAYAILIDSADNSLNAITKVKELVPVAQAYYHSLSVSTLTAAEDNKVTQRGFTLEQNYPNPFNPSTAINYQLAESGKVTLKVYDILGNEVITLINEEQAAGRHQAVFSTADKKTLASGVYFYRLQAGANSVVKKMILMK